MAIDINSVRKFMHLARQAEVIFESEADWSTKYELIFGMSIQKETGIFFDWLDMDTSYQEDVSNYMCGLREKMGEFYKIQAKLDEMNIETGPKPIPGHVYNWTGDTHTRPSTMAAIGLEHGDYVQDIFGMAQQIYVTGWNVMVTRNSDGEAILYYDSRRFQQR